ncbi:MAG: hypothetical protein LUD39_06960, partial [Opitutae bacterium]|nr:hypothetical protein [Opitutae bacterium]
ISPLTQDLTTNPRSHHQPKISPPTRATTNPVLTTNPRHHQPKFHHQAKSHHQPTTMRRRYIVGVRLLRR